MSLMCVYQDCLSVKYPCGRIAFFGLPSDHRRSTWIRNSGNKALLKISQKAQRYFCENHFRECDISNQFNRKLLKRDALPLEHPSLAGLKQNSEDDCLYEAVESIAATTTTTVEQTNMLENTTGLVENVEESPNLQDLYYDEFKVIDSSKTATSTTPIDASSGVPYRLLEFYDDDDEEPTTEAIIVEKPEEQPEAVVTTNTQNNEKQEPFEIYIEENSNDNQVDSSTIELEEQKDLEDIEAIYQEAEECSIPAKKKRPNEMEAPALEVQSNETVELPPPNNNNSYEEDKHFALSLVGYFQRLPQGKKSLAKLKILQYLTELEIDLPPSL